MDFRKINQKSPQLSMKEIAKLKDLFEQKNWPIEGDYDEPVFENFCNWLAGYNPEQCDLLISLTEKFLWIRNLEYNKYFFEAFQLFINSFSFSNRKKVMICPAIPENDFGKTKSSVVLLYLIKANIFAIQKRFSDFAITYIDSPNSVNLADFQKDFTFCLIDDFIGTGETFSSAVDYLINVGIKKEQIALVSLVGMKDGIKYLKDKGYATYSAIECDKGLSDTGNEKQIDTMKSIEESICVEDKFKFGYNASEALVRMIRTPNNTFPVYWYHKKSINIFAPFPR